MQNPSRELALQADYREREGAALNRGFNHWFDGWMQVGVPPTSRCYHRMMWGVFWHVGERQTFDASVLARPVDGALNFEIDIEAEQPHRFLVNANLLDEVDGGYRLRDPLLASFGAARCILDGDGMLPTRPVAPGATARTTERWWFDTLRFLVVGAHDEDAVKWMRIAMVAIGMSAGEVVGLLEHLDLPLAELLNAQFKGRLAFPRLHELAPEAAAHLARTARPELRLDRLRPTEEVLEALALFEGGVLAIGTEGVTPEQLEPISRFRARRLVLVSLTLFTADIAAMVARFPGEALDLRAVEAFDLKAATALVPFGGDTIVFGRLRVAPEVAEVLSSFHGQVRWQVAMPDPPTPRRPHPRRAGPPRPPTGRWAQGTGRTASKSGVDRGIGMHAGPAAGVLDSPREFPAVVRSPASTPPQREVPRQAAQQGQALITELAGLPVVRPSAERGVSPVSKPGAAIAPEGDDERPYGSLHIQFLAAKIRMSEDTDNFDYPAFEVLVVALRDQTIRETGCRDVRFEVVRTERHAYVRAEPVW